MDKRKSITWKNFKEGDIIITLNGDRCKVMGRFGEVFARSSWWKYDVFQEICGIENAKRMDWRFIQPDGKIPMKQKEIEKFFSSGIKIIK